ncbi:SDR family NAD(P)-dependent oxidoreductase [Streptomyces sp. NBC_01190]|uniref:SDR family NAD(P)-dependent oxidoreductase n=1 Tax=Streptomyces sp. NBC_01190 TaxID=2903767 RepID=UPI003866AFF1|nr:SDR family NAD(P)-dependent oxidoreductase [Streptomyces sp. NBC_01190]
MSKIVLVTAASTGLGAMTAFALARAGHTVYAGFGPADDVLPDDLTAVGDQVLSPDARLHPLALDTADQRSVSAAIGEVTRRSGRVDAVIHALGPVPRGPVESFTPYQLAQIYDAHVLSSQRVNRAVLPAMRERRDGLLIWVVPARDGADATPYLALHAEAVTVIDHLAASYAKELAGFGIEVSTVTCGSLAAGVGRHPGLIHPDDTETFAAYDVRHPGLVESVDTALARQAADAADIAETAGAIVGLVNDPKGRRGRRVTTGTPPGPGH